MAGRRTKGTDTVRHLGSHTSGLSDSTTEDVKHEQQPGWKGEFWQRLDPPRDPFTLARDQTPLLFEPGTQFQYSNPGIGLLTYCVTAALSGNGPRDVRTTLRERILKPIGVADDQWTAGYGKTFTVDNLPLVPTWGGGNFTARAAARIGRLVLREGNWEGRQLLRPEVVREVTTDAGLVEHCGMGWWSNGGNRYKDLPKDAVWGAGAGDQLLLVIPSLGLVMVRFGETLAPGPEEPPIRKDDVFTMYHDYRARILFEPLARAFSNQTPAAAPYPSSPAIQELRWAPAETIVRQARGSDNWPMTWADNDLLYTAYGDGNGFAPFTPEKLSMGLAVIAGSPSRFLGTNLRSAGIEAKGQGAAGLWCQILPNSRHPQGPRFQGGFGVYDAPEPWGPWTTVYFTNEWDVGPGESSSFPTKWMSADGTRIHLVFSGDDCFSVRSATLQVRER